MRTYSLISLPPSNSHATLHAAKRLYAGTRCASQSRLLNLYAGGPATVAGPLKTTKELARETGLAKDTYRYTTTPLAQRHPEGLQARWSCVLGES
jgi:hypothetical protein